MFPHIIQFNPHSESTRYVVVLLPPHLKDEETEAYWGWQLLNGYCVTEPGCQPSMWKADEGAFSPQQGTILSPLMWLYRLSDSTTVSLGDETRSSLPNISLVSHREMWLTRDAGFVVSMPHTFLALMREGAENNAAAPGKEMPW